MLLGVDVSQYQTVIDWPALYAAGYRFAYVRCCEGLVVDPLHDKHIAGARAAGLVAGSYQFGHPSLDAVELAKLFLEHADLTEMRPVIDMESLQNGAVPPNASQWADAWCEWVKRHAPSPPSFIEPIIYASTSYWRVMVGLMPSIGGPLGWDWWLAMYLGPSTPPPTRPIVGYPYVAHQFAGNVPVTGQAGLWDLDVVYADDLDALRV
jgi:lysozyme